MIADEIRFAQLLGLDPFAPEGRPPEPCPITPETWAHWERLREGLGIREPSAARKGRPLSRPAILAGFQWGE